MTRIIDLFWSFRSPYSYIVVPRLIALEAERDVKINVRPVLPIAVRQPEFFAHADPLWTSYLMRDCVRSAEFAGLTLRWPRPDPVVMDYATRTYPKEQPHIHRLTRLGVLASERGQGLAVLRAVSPLIWSGETDGWDQGNHLARAFTSAGCDLDEMDAVQTAEAERLDEVIKQNEADQRLGGHYGVPLMVLDGEPFFGQDRVDQLIWRIDQT
jgi:2-hydroxychromene-2-carboxylate isomerase